MPCGGNNWPKIIYMLDREVVSNGMRGEEVLGIVVVKTEFCIPCLQLCVSFQLFILVDCQFKKGREFQTTMMNYTPQARTIDIPPWSEIQTIFSRRRHQ